MERPADPMSDELPDNAEAVGGGRRLDRMADVPDPLSFTRTSDALV
jgi:hypothetical protein